MTRRPAAVSKISPIAEAQQPRLAAIDLGSHSFHLTVGHIRHNGQLHIDYRLRHVVRLADGLKTKSKQLSEEACKRALSSLKTFAEVLTQFPQEQWRVVGTETLRKARNDANFLQAAQAICQRPIEILSGTEEANLIYLGVAKMRAHETQKRLVVDIGGGSTELIIGKNESILQTTSLPIGCIGITKKLVKQQQDMDAIVSNIRNQLLPIAHQYHQQGFDVALGASGAIRSVAHLTHVLSLPFNYEGLCQLQTIWRTKVNIIQQQLTHHQQAIFPGTLAILIALFDTFALLSLAAVPSSLAEGVLYQISENYK